MPTLSIVSVTIALLQWRGPFCCHTKALVRCWDLSASWLCLIIIGYRSPLLPFSNDEATKLF